MSDSANAAPGCLLGLFNATFGALWRAVLRLFGLNLGGAQAGLVPPDTQYQQYVDTWVSERIALWLHETRSEINAENAAKVLMGQRHLYPEAAIQVQETLLDAKVTFSQRDTKQYLEIEAYMMPRQSNGKQPQVLRWRAEREIMWQDIPNDVRERLIRLRQPITLSYSVPNGQ
jgi:hypothetical protein